jgi:L-arabinonolactonase
MEPNGAKKTWTLREPIGSLALRQSGGAILSLRSGFFTFDFTTGETKRICETQSGELRPRLNDGKVDRQGRFVAGSMDFEERAPVGKLFRLDPDLSVHTLDREIICSNGPCWSPDGRILYFADTSRRAIYAYDYDTATGQVQSRRLFANFETLRGFPDGATVDEEGYVWSVEVYSGRLIRFDPLGVIDRIVGLPVQSTTSLIFGGANLNVAYVTSMARPMNGQYHREREAVVCSRSMISACAACPNRALLADWDYRSTRTIMRIEVIVDVKTTLGEGPLWDVEQERLYWIDSFDGRVFRATVAGGEIRCWDVPQKIGSMALRKDGSGAVVSLARGFHLLDFKSGDVELIIDPEPDKQNNRLNDGKVDKRGRFVAGSMDTMEEGPNGALYRLDPDFSLHKLDEKIIVSNGPCWSPDGATFYFADTWTGDIWAYDYDQSTGAASNRRTFVSVDRSRGGAADGSTVDAEGCLWNALVYDGRLVRYDPNGRIDRVIDMPVKKITSVMFGGPNLDILFITSMAKPPLPRFPGDGRLRGSLFAIYDLGIRGLPEPRFGA